MHGRMKGAEQKAWKTKNKYRETSSSSIFIESQIHIRNMSFGFDVIAKFSAEQIAQAGDICCISFDNTVCFSFHIDEK